MPGPNPVQAVQEAQADVTWHEQQRANRVKLKKPSHPLVFLTLWGKNSVFKTVGAIALFGGLAALAVAAAPVALPATITIGGATVVSGGLGGVLAVLDTWLNSSFRTDEKEQIQTLNDLEREFDDDVAPDLVVSKLSDDQKREITQLVDRIVAASPEERRQFKDALPPGHFLNAEAGGIPLGAIANPEAAKAALTVSINSNLATVFTDKAKKQAIKSERSAQESKTAMHVVKGMIRGFWDLIDFTSIGTAVAGTALTLLGFTALGVALSNPITAAITAGAFLVSAAVGLGISYAQRSYDKRSDARKAEINHLSSEVHAKKSVLESLFKEPGPVFKGFMSGLKTALGIGAAVEVDADPVNEVGRPQARPPVRVRADSVEVDPVGAALDANAPARPVVAVPASEPELPAAPVGRSPASVEPGVAAAPPINLQAPPPRQVFPRVRSHSVGPTSSVAGDFGSASPTLHTWRGNPATKAGAEQARAENRRSANPGKDTTRPVNTDQALTTSVTEIDMGPTNGHR